VLYLIIDKKKAGPFWLRGVSKKIKGTDIDIVQLRDKKSAKSSIIRDAFFIRKALSETRAIFIVNDYLDAAKIAGADGIHLGQSDVSPKIARMVLGRDRIIGVSCHNLKQALAAQKSGADYIGIGPVFPTPTKPEYRPIGLKLIKALNRKVRIPFFVIGGVNLENIDKIIASGAKRVAVCRAILNAGDITSAIKKFSTILH